MGSEMAVAEAVLSELPELDDASRALLALFGGKRR